MDKHHYDFCVLCISGQHDKSVHASELLLIEERDRKESRQALDEEDQK